MRNLIRAGLAILVLSFAAPVAAGPLEDGEVAYLQGDYGTALRLWLPLANQGIASAQCTPLARVCRGTMRRH